MLIINSGVSVTSEGDDISVCVRISGEAEYELIFILAYAGDINTG